MEYAVFQGDIDRSGVNLSLLRATFPSSTPTHGTCQVTPNSHTFSPKWTAVPVSKNRRQWNTFIAVAVLLAATVFFHPLLVLADKLYIQLAAIIASVQVHSHWRGVGTYLLLVGVIAAYTSGLAGVVRICAGVARLLALP